MRRCGNTGWNLGGILILKVSVNVLSLKGGGTGGELGGGGARARRPGGGGTGGELGGGGAGLAWSSLGTWPPSPGALLLAGDLCFANPMDGINPNRRGAKQVLH